MSSPNTNLFRFLPILSFLSSLPNRIPPVPTHPQPPPKSISHFQGDPCILSKAFPITPFHVLQTHYLLTKKPVVQVLTGVIFKSLQLLLTYGSHHFPRKCTSCHNKLWESARLKCMSLSTELTVAGFLIYIVPLYLRLSALMFTLSGLLSLWGAQHFFLHLDFTLNLAFIFLFTSVSWNAIAFSLHWVFSRQT